MRDRLKEFAKLIVYLDNLSPKVKETCKLYLLNEDDRSRIGEVLNELIWSSVGDDLVHNFDSDDELTVKVFNSLWKEK